MTSRWIEPISKVRWYQEHQPEYLAAIHCRVYDRDGNETIVKAYRLDDMLARGFLEAPPQHAAAPAEPEPPEHPAPAPVGVRSKRLYPQRARKKTDG